jgi:sugar fermentation stimulation protein A
MDVEIPREPGSYVLELSLDAPHEIAVGRLGTVCFQAGWYYYSGSALGGLRGRVLRHLTQKKARHWHIDALREHAELRSIHLLVSTERRECAVAQCLARLPLTKMPVPRFGASDCRCSTHLFYAPESIALALGPGWVHLGKSTTNHLNRPFTEG